MMHFDGCIDESASNHHYDVFVNLLIRLCQHGLETCQREQSQP